MQFFLIFFKYIFYFLYVEIKLNIISLYHKLVGCPSLERDWSDHLPIPGWVTPQIFIHTVTVVSGSPKQQQTSLTSAGMVYTLIFLFVLVCLVIIDPVLQGDAQLSHPLCQGSAVPVTVWCNGLPIQGVPQKCTLFLYYLYLQLKLRYFKSVYFIL